MLIDVCNSRVLHFHGKCGAVIPIAMLILFLPLADYFVDYGLDKKADSSILCLDHAGQLLQLPRLQLHSSHAPCYVRSPAASTHENLLWCHALPVLLRCGVGLRASFLACVHRREIVPSRAKLCWHAFPRELCFPLCH